jgi:hypothetical protein
LHLLAIFPFIELGRESGDRILPALADHSRGEAVVTLQLRLHVPPAR